MNMKNVNFQLLSFLLVITMFFSCSKDDDSIIQEPEEPAIKRYISTFKHIQGGNPDYTYEHTFLYNTDNTLDKISWEYYLNEFNSEIVTYKFSYDSNKRVNKIEQYLNGEILDNETTTITYDESGFVNQLGSFLVTYNSTLNAYSMQLNNYTLNYVFNEEQDIKVYDNLTMSYDTQKKGAGYDSQNQILILLMRSILGSELILPLSKRPLTSYSFSVGERVYSNEYDEEGYIIKATETTFNDIYEFTYITL